MSLGNSMEKNLVAGIWYLILTVVVDTFFSTSLLTYSPPGAHAPGSHDSTSTQSMPNLRARSPRDSIRPPAPPPADSDSAGDADAGSSRCDDDIGTPNVFFYISFDCLGFFNGTTRALSFLLARIPKL